jgi:hypothetical protein
MSISIWVDLPDPSIPSRLKKRFAVFMPVNMQKKAPVVGAWS